MNAAPALPGPIGPYAHFVAAGNLIFTSGQLPVNPATGELVAEIRAAAAQALDNLRAVLEAAGSGLDRVVKTTVFLADLRDFAVVNEVYAGCFPTRHPARSCVQVAALPRGARIEIEAVAERKA